MSYDEMNSSSDLPEVRVDIGASDIKIELRTVAEDLLFDQGSGMVASIGCISNPGGPSC